MFPKRHMPLLLLSLFLALLAALSGHLPIDEAHGSETDGSSRGVHRNMLKAVTREQGVELSLYAESHALLIGASRYSDWPHLPSISGELDMVEEALSSTGFDVSRLVDPTSSELKSGITEFINSYGYEPENRLLIYFSGHGHSVGDKGFLLPIDIPLPEHRQEFRRKALPMTQILAWAKDMEAKHVLFVFDSCFSGSVFKSKSMPEDQERYIRKATAYPVRQFITAGSANEEVPAKSTFTPAFVAAIKGEGDLNHDGYITGSELGVHLSQLVPQFIDQTPQYGKIREYGLSRGDFVFFSGKTESDRPSSASMSDVSTRIQTPIASDAIEVMVWQSAEKGNSLTEYEAYVKQYPGGLFRSIASARIDNFRNLKVGLPIPSEDNRLYFEPEMIRLPKGSFLMGSVDGNENAQPVQIVNVSPFEISKYEITFDEFDQFTLANALENIEDNGWGRGKRPVINVSWKMAKDYTRWLSDLTGKRYRLPIEAEWEYAARSGSEDHYSFGNDQSLLCEHANISFKAKVCTDEFKFTAPVGSFNANGWGLHDMHGNVWEWTEDCWHPNYLGAPSNGRAWIRGGNCDQRVVRGGAWYSEPGQLESSQRNKNRMNGSSDSTGIRVVRMIDDGEAG